MIGNGHWSTGITVAYAYSGMNRMGWGAVAQFLDGGFCNDSADDGQVSTEGEIRSRYRLRDGAHADALTVVIDAVKADAERLGIQWRDPSLYYKGDGKDEEYPPPEGWEALMQAQAERLGWRTYYRNGSAGN